MSQDIPYVLDQKPWKVTLSPLAVDKDVTLLVTAPSQDPAKIYDNPLKERGVTPLAITTKFLHWACLQTKLEKLKTKPSRSLIPKQITSLVTKPPTTTTTVSFPATSAHF